jgi:hypothetical protein
VDSTALTARLLLLIRVALPLLWGVVAWKQVGDGHQQLALTSILVAVIWSAAAWRAVALWHDQRRYSASGDELLSTMVEMRAPEALASGTDAPAPNGPAGA